MDQTRPSLDALKKDPQAARLLKDPAGLKSLLSAPETQQLMSLLGQSAGDGLRSAAQAAAGGKPQALQALLAQVMASEEGAAAVAGIQKKAEQK